MWGDEWDGHSGRGEAARQRPAKRGADVGVRRGVVRAVRGTRDVEPGEADEEVDGQREHSVRLVLGLSLERRDHAAVQELLWGVDHEAAVENGPPRVETAVQPDALGKPRVDRDADEVVSTRELPVRVRQRYQVCDLTVFAGRDVGEVAHRVTTASW